MYLTADLISLDVCPIGHMLVQGLSKQAHQVLQWQDAGVDNCHNSQQREHWREVSELFKV